MIPLWKRIFVLFAIAMFLSSSTLYAGWGSKGKCAEKCDKRSGYGKLTKDLGLTKEQEGTLESQRKEFRDKNKELRERMMEKSKELKEELDKPAVDNAKVNRITEDIKNITGEKITNRVNKITAMKKVLTPEQYQKLQQKMERKHKRWNKRKGKMQ